MAAAAIIIDSFQDQAHDLQTVFGHAHRCYTRYSPALVAKVAGVAALHDSNTGDFEERAAICEYDGGLTRDQAEQVAALHAAPLGGDNRAAAGNRYRRRRSVSRSKAKRGNYCAGGLYKMKAQHTLVERTKSIDIRELAQDGAWKRPYTIVRFPIQNLVVLNRFRVEYRNSRWPRERRTQIIPVVWTRCFLGGMRPWFACRCGKRAARLFSTTMGLYGCRACSGVAYASQRHSPKRRVYLKAQLVRRILRDSRGRPGVDPLPQRPYRMHQRTFRRHIAVLRGLEAQLRSGRTYRPKYRRQWDA
jgi:hypothetical protein